MQNRTISKINYYVNSKIVSGSSKNMIFKLNTFLGLKKTNIIKIKVVDNKNKVYEKFYKFTMADI